MRSDNNRYNTDTSTPPHNHGVNESHDLDWIVDGYDIDVQCEPGYLVIAAVDISVPTRAVAMIDVNVRDAVACLPLEISGDLLVERRDKFEDPTGLRVGRTLIDASQVIPVIEIMNTSDTPVLVRKGTVIGIGEIVSDFINFGLEISNVIDNEQLTTNQASDDNETEPNFLVHYGPLTKHVSELINRITGDLSPEVTSEDKKEIDAMLCRNLIGLDLFNDDTRPSGHISRPTQVNVSQELLSFSKKPSYTGKCVSELLSFSKYLLKSDHIVHVWGLLEVNKLHHIR